MAKKKKTRKDTLKHEDEFLTFSAKAAEFARTHRQQLAYIGLVVFLILASYAGGFLYLRSINKGGQNAYNAAYYVAAQISGSVVSSENLKKSEPLFRKVIEEYGHSKAARLSLPQVAFASFVEKKYDEAIELYQDFLNKVSGDMFYESLTRLALASCHEAKGELETAMEIIKPVVERTADPFNETAMFSLARLYRLDNKSDRSKEILEKLIEEHQDSPLIPMAKALL
jgi:predicted negative regulator of RcsB-dependent stress response